MRAQVEARVRIGRPARRRSIDRRRRPWRDRIGRSARSSGQRLCEPTLCSAYEAAARPCRPAGRPRLIGAGRAGPTNAQLGAQARALAESSRPAVRCAARCARNQTATLTGKLRADGWAASARPAPRAELKISLPGPARFAALVACCSPAAAADATATAAPAAAVRQRQQQRQQRQRPTLRNASRRRGQFNLAGAHEKGGRVKESASSSELIHQSMQMRTRPRAALSRGAHGAARARSARYFSYSSRQSIGGGGGGGIMCRRRRRADAREPASRPARNARSHAGRLATCCARPAAALRD
jgi:hypothetical protein